jgi:formylmethanofuran dehydrogenase subunit D
MKRINNALLFFASMLLLAGCQFQYSGHSELNNVYTYTIEEKLETLEISGGPDVVVDSTIGKNEVRVLSNTDDFSKLVVKAENGKLVVSHKRNIGNKEYKVFVPAFDYKALVIAGGGDLEWYSCNVDELALTVSGGADCEIKGKCNSLSVVASGGADADLGKLIAENVSVVASGGSDVELHAVRTIAVTASGGSDITIAGTPQILGWNVSGGSDVNIVRR